MRRTLLVALLAVLGCDVEVLRPGQVGPGRYVGEVSWEDGTTRLLPPIRDRQGNVYVGLGAIDQVACNLDSTDVLIGSTHGSWSSCSDLREGSRDAHGWVGFGEKDAFFWTGDALVHADAEEGSCTSIVDADPTSGADINFMGVVPWLWDRPSRRTLLALVKTPSDPLPFHVVVDVDAGLYTDLRRFEPETASQVTVVGVAGNLDARIGMLLVWYVEDDAGHLVAIFLDEDGEETSRVTVDGVAGSTETTGGGSTWTDRVLGFGAMNDEGEVVAVLDSGEVLLVDPGSARVERLSGMTPRGAQLWEGRRWIVGLDEAGPVLVEAKGSSLGSVQRWSTSVDLSLRIQDGLDILDERHAPRRVLTWSDTESAIGPYPLVAPFSLLPYNDGSVGWLIGGPSFVNATYGNECRSVAFVPMGVSYP